MSPKLSKPLSPGDVITEDMPIIHVLYMKFKGKYCDNCVQRSDQLKRCSECLEMYYCGKECQKNDWKYHKNECSFYSDGHELSRKLTSGDWLRLWLRLYLLVQNIPTFATKKYRLFDGSEVSLNDIKDNVIESDEDYVEIHLFNAVTCGYFSELGIEYEYKELIKWFAFMRNFLTISIQCGDHRDVRPSAVATGLYIQLSTVGHSCRPNSAIVYNFNGHAIELRAMRSIAPGEEITINRVDLNLNLESRKKALKNEGLICRCVKCVDNTDRDVDYKRLQESANQSAIAGLTSDAEKEAYYRSLFTDLNAVYGENHPNKTLTLIDHIDKYANHLVDSRSAPDTTYHVLRVYTARALEVTNAYNCPFKIRLAHILNGVSHLPFPIHLYPSIIAKLKTICFANLDINSI